MKKSRRTLHASPEFLRKLRQIQGEIKSKRGEEPSLTDLTDKMLRVPAFQDVEKQILSDNNLDFTFKIKFDKKII